MVRAGQSLAVAGSDCVPACAGPGSGGSGSGAGAASLSAPGRNPLPAGSGRWPAAGLGQVGTGRGQADRAAIGRMVRWQSARTQGAAWRGTGAAAAGHQRTGDGPRDCGAAQPRAGARPARAGRRGHRAVQGEAGPAGAADAAGRLQLCSSRVVHGDRGDRKYSRQSQADRAGKRRRTIAQVAAQSVAARAREPCRITRCDCRSLCQRGSRGDCRGRRGCDARCRADPLALDQRTACQRDDRGHILPGAAAVCLAALAGTAGAAADPGGGGRGGGGDRLYPADRG